MGIIVSAQIFLDWLIQFIIGGVKDHRFRFAIDPLPHVCQPSSPVIIELFEDSLVF